MTAAQALKSGMLALSGAIRSTEAVRVEKSATSFKDTLDSASRSSANPPQGASSEPVRASDTRDYATKDRSDTRDDRTTDERDDGKRSTRGEADAASTEQQAVVTDLSLVLAALGGAGAAEAPDGGTEFDESLVALQSAVANTALISETGDPLEQGPVLPGQTGDVSETLDAAKLLALLKSPGVAEAPSTDVAAETVEVTATVLGQETHLAIDTLPQANGQVSETLEAGSVGVAQMSAKAAEGSLDATERARGRINSEAATEGEPVAERAGGAPAPDTRGSVGGALADQGIAGQDGRQQEGSASSNGSSQQSSTGVFASMVAGARSQDVQSAADGEPAAFDPLSEQIAAEVRAELRADGLGESSSDGVVKVLHLQLKPANLGAMTVRLSLRDNVISIHLETQHRDTLAVIEREREALVGALSSAGYTVDGVTTATQNDISRSSGVQSGFSDRGASASQGQANQGQGLANSSGGQARQEQRGSFGGQAYSGPSDGKDISGNGARRDGDGLYV